MRMNRGLILVALLSLSACSDYERGITLKDLRSFSGGPDEFMVLPRKTLEMPKDLAALPAPTPGASNRTDQNPIGDAVVALGGRPQAEGGNPSASDGALVNYTRRNGVPADIRTTLATEDKEFRTKQSRFTKLRIVRVDRYNEAYRRQTLNSGREAERYRAAGAMTPSSPPTTR